MRLATCGWESGFAEESGTLTIIQSGSESIVATARSGSFGWRPFTVAWAAGSTICACQRTWVLPGNPSEIWVRFGCAKYETSYTGANMTLFPLELYDGTTIQLALGFQSGSSAIRLYRGSTLIASGGVWPGASQTYVCIEVHAKIHASAGEVQVWVNGVLVIDFAGDTLESATAQLTHVSLGLRRTSGEFVGTYHSHAMQFDDVAINDASGSVNNGRIGQGGVFPLRPTADIEQGFTPSTGSDNYAMVDEAQADGDATYVSGLGSGTRDLYVLEDLAAAGQIDNMQMIVVGRSIGGVGGRLRPTIKTGALIAVGSQATFVKSYSGAVHHWETNPETSLPWTLTEINSLQGGMTAN